MPPSVVSAPSPRESVSSPTRRAIYAAHGVLRYPMETMIGTVASTVRTGDPPPSTRRLAFGLAAVVAFSLAAAFFAWVSAEPLWLAVGHGQPGTATVTRCDSHGSEYACVTFQAADGAYTVPDVAVRGARPHGLGAEGSVPARMVSPRGDRAYAVDTTGLNLRWAVGLVLVLLCGLGTAWATGAARLADRGARRRAVLACLAAPLLLAAGFLTAAW